VEEEEGEGEMMDVVLVSNRMVFTLIQVDQKDTPTA
jgi:hypothetical protein